MASRPFDDYRTAIDDPEYFFGRTTLLKYFRQNFNSVQVLLGGQRIGKTSTLRAIEWSMLGLPPDGRNSPFPVLINMQEEQPHSADQFRYLLIGRLRDAIGRYLGTSDETSWKDDLRRAYQRFVGMFDEVTIDAHLAKLKLKKPSTEINADAFRAAIRDGIEDLQERGFRGILFLLDEAGFVTRTDWGNDAWSHIRGFKDTDPLKGLVGLIVSGFRGVLEYQQRVGSPLKNIAKVIWMTDFEGEEANRVIARRFAEEREPIRDGDHAFLRDYSGGHPFLLQQLISILIDERRKGDPSHEAVARRCRKEHKQIFRDWWNSEGVADGLTEDARIVYGVMPQNGRVSRDDLQNRLNMREDPFDDALDILCGSGLVRVIIYLTHNAVRTTIVVA